MTYRFGEFELDLAVVELRRSGTVVPIEPQVFRLLAFLIENRDRMVSKDEIIEKVWDGRVVSDSALTSRVKTARKAVGDDGSAQKLIRTVRGRGFRFVGAVDPAAEQDDRQAEAGGSVQITSPASSSPESSPLGDQTAGRPSVAVLPWVYAGSNESFTLLAEAIPHELITALSRLRWLSVIARGSSFRFRSPDVDVVEVGRALNVGYCVMGLLEGNGRSLSVSVDLINAQDRSVLWSETLGFRLDDVHEMREKIVSSIVSALEIRIPFNEAQQARLKAAESLDAWAEYHLGLQATYRFNRHDNSAAEQHFKRALQLDPGFARAHAGLSFTSFQEAFLNYSANAHEAAARARRHAERGIELDPLDPFANFTMGRSLYLAGDIESGIGWLDRSVELSPSFAQGRYSLGWARTIIGQETEGRGDVVRAMDLSPLDPLLYAMRATRALTHLVAGEWQAAVPWAEKAALSPGAHVLISIIATLAHGLAGNDGRARHWADNVRQRRPDVTAEHFFQSFPFAATAMRREFEGVLSRYDL